MARRRYPPPDHGGVIMEAREFALHARINGEKLNAWLEAGWLAPQRNDEGTHYSERDVARARLIEDLKDLGINDEGVPVILDLVDQLHGLRRVLRELLSRIHSQPEAARRRLVADLHRAMSERTDGTSLNTNSQTR